MCPYERTLFVMFLDTGTNTLFKIAKASSPLILTIPIPPSPAAVATAAIVSSLIFLSFIYIQNYKV